MLYDSEEIQQIAISVIALSVGLSMAFVGVRTFLSLSIINSVSLFLLIFFTAGLGFILHELAHKFTAMRFGIYAAYRAWPIGLFIMVALPLVGFPLFFAAPGAVYIFAHRYSRKLDGLISLAGPLTNAVLAGAFFFLAIAYGLSGLPNYTLVNSPAIPFTINSFFSLGIMINVWLGFFNMIPVFPLDGSKVFAWDWRVWLALTGLLGILFIVF